MPSPINNCLARRRDSSLALLQNPDFGFSLIEMMVSVLIILLLMSAIFPFIMQSQKRFQGNQVISESNQSARAALEVMSQEIGQAGYNPQFSTGKTSSASLSANGCTQYMQLSDITGISPGDWVSVDTGVNQELVEVFSTSSAVTAPVCAPSICVCAAAPAAPWIQAKFETCHNNTTAPCNAPVNPYIISSNKFPFGGGLLFDTGLSTSTLSNAQRLSFFGDINQDAVINNVIYSISPMVPAKNVTINGVVYGLYNLYRSIKSVDFPSLPTAVGYAGETNATASPMVEKVLFNTATAAACTSGVAGCGPTGMPIFAYPDTVTVGVVPNQITVVGTIVITLCVAVNPTSLETNTVQWYTMSTQIRPLNLSAAINVNQSNGSLYLAPSPKSLPMALPAGYAP